MPPDSSDFLDSDFDDEKIRNAISKEEPKGKYKCSNPGCDMSFKRMTYLDRHEYNHTGIKKHICKFEGCDKKYIILEHLKRHIKRFHEKNFPPKVISCLEESCKAKFRSMWDMEKHHKVAHENLKPHVCPECQECFRRKMQLRKHMIKHTGEYPFKCNACGRGFLLGKVLERHECTKYTCKECEAEFSKWSELCAHQKEHNCVIFSCEVCSKTFKRRENLRAHMQSHQPNEDRDVYPCTHEGCTRFYFHPKNLDAHIRTSHEKKPLKCTYEDCGKEYCSKTTLKRHIHNCHESTKPAKVRKKQAQRKDFGKKKISTAAALSGITVDRATNKMLLNGEGDQIETSEIELIMPTEIS